MSLLKTRHVLFVVALQLCSVSASSADDGSNSILQKIQQSHITDNVPSEGQFDKILQHDLNACFSNALKFDAHVEYELLRKGATQSGASYPKYYAWVKIYDGKVMGDQGAVRLEAQNGTKFVITNFFSSEVIKKDPTQLKTAFPVALCGDIEQRARAAK